jgi:tetratricopeptide (TPR) repeat protein
MASVLALRGLTYLIYEYDWAKAKADLDEALGLSPQNELAHCFLSHMHVAQGRFDEALAHAHIAAEVDFGSPMTVITEPWILLYSGQVSEAVRKAEEAVETFPQFAIAYALLGHAYCADGATTKAIKQYENALELDYLPEVVASLAYIYGEMRNRKKALDMVASLDQAKRDGKIAYVSSYFEALAWAGLGQKGRCLDALERAFDERCDWLIHLAVEPRWRELRGERRFLSLARRIGIAKPTWA